VEELAPSCAPMSPHPLPHEVDAIIDLDVGIDVAMDTGITTQNMHVHLQTRAKHMHESGNSITLSGNFKCCAVRINACAVPLHGGVSSSVHEVKNVGVGWTST
jgi:hypothetical protein